MTTSPSPAARRLAGVRARADAWVLERGAAGPGRRPAAPGVAEAGLLLALALRRAFRQPLATAAALANRLAVPIGAILAAVAYRRADRRLPVRPKSLLPSDGWWSWYDQGKTLEALLAWRHHVESVANQWYQPLYPAIGALSLSLTRNRPFLLADLIGLVASLALFVPIAGLLGVGRLMAVAVFLAINLGEPTILDNWVIPWNTSLTTPLLLLGLLSAARIAAGARRPWLWAAGFGFAVGLIPALRPTDAVVLLPAGGLAMASLLAGWGADVRPRLPEAARVAAGAICGFVPAFGLLLALYVPIFGLRPSPYMELSSLTGFDLNLLPLHWVMLVVGPRPLFAGLSGLVEVYWWLVPCLAGMIAVLLRCLFGGPPSGRNLINLMVAATIVPYWCLYLCYRDLHPTGLWVFHNFHYFVWTLPLLGVYGVLLLRLCAAGVHEAWRSGPAAGAATSWPVAAGVVVTVLALCWRPQLDPWPIPPPAPTLDVADSRVTIPGGLSNMRDALLVAATDPAGSLYFGPHRLREGDLTTGQFFGFRAFPIPGGAMVLPLRSLPKADGVLQFVGSVHLDPTFRPRLWRQDMVFGLPCWVPRIVRPKSCLVDTVLPGPLFPQGRQIDFDSRMEVPFLIPGGWADQSDGRWTLGYHSSMQFRVPVPPAGQGIVIEVEGAGFLPRGSGTLVVDVTANRVHVAQWRISTTEGVALRADIPASLIPADGEVRLTLSALNARRPIDAVAGATDRRLLGFRVRAVRLLPWSER